MIIKVLNSIYANTANCLKTFAAQIRAHLLAGAYCQLCHKNRGREHVKTVNISLSLSLSLIIAVLSWLNVLLFICTGTETVSLGARHVLFCFPARSLPGVRATLVLFPAHLTTTYKYLQKRFFYQNIKSCTIRLTDNHIKLVAPGGGQVVLCGVSMPTFRRPVFWMQTQSVAYRQQPQQSHELKVFHVISRVHI